MTGIGRKVVAACASAGIPCAHMAFPEGSGQGLPFAVYVKGESRDQYADGANRRHITPVSLELYTAPDDTASAPAIEEAIAAFGGWAREEEIWVEADHCIETVYTFTLVEEE